MTGVQTCALPICFPVTIQRFDGSGLIVSTFVSGGAYNEPGVLVSAGDYSTNSWENTYDGGVATDNFN